MNKLAIATAVADAAALMLANLDRGDGPMARQRN